MPTVYTAEEKKLAKRMYNQFYGLIYPEKFRESYRKYRLANINKIKEKNRKWRLNNLEKAREEVRKYYLANINKVKEWRVKYLAKKRYGSNWELALKIKEKNKLVKQKIIEYDELMRSLK